MADSDFYTKSQNLSPDQITPNPTKFYTNFLYKAIIVSIFLIAVPLFPSQAPDFINQTLHTGSWELLQLLFVGIAVSYGLFSKRSDETETETEKEKEAQGSKFDNAQSYVSRLLQVSSVFDDETENPSESEDSKVVQTWNSQYYRGEPMVVVAAQENSVLDQEQRLVSNPQKPLLLPVRSLKSLVSDNSNMTDQTNESNFKANSNSLSRSNSKLGSRRFSSSSDKSRNGEFRGVSPEDSVEKHEENVVLCSPIPWRSRSGRMEVKKEDIEESDFNLQESRSSFRSQSFNLSRTNSTFHSPYKLSPSPSLPSEILQAEDFVRKKNPHKSSSIPPPPPPPPPPFFYKSNSRLENNESLSEKEKEMRRIVRNAMNGMKRNEADQESSLSRGNSKSVRTSREREFSGGFVNAKVEKRSSENVAPFLGKRDYFVQETAHEQNFYEYPKEEEEKEECIVMEMETKNDSESEDYDEDDEFEEIASKEEMALNKNASDVDKKADEFIAKFREQIRLQRIASIRKSSAGAGGQPPKTSVVR